MAFQKVLPIAFQLNRCKNETEFRTYLANCSYIVHLCASFLSGFCLK